MNSLKLAQLLGQPCNFCAWLACLVCKALYLFIHYVSIIPLCIRNGHSRAPSRLRWCDERQPDCRHCLHDISYRIIYSRVGRQYAGLPYTIRVGGGIWRRMWRLHKRLLCFPGAVECTGYIEGQPSASRSIITVSRYPAGLESNGRLRSL